MENNFTCRAIFYRLLGMIFLLAILLASDGVFAVTTTTITHFRAAQTQAKTRLVFDLTHHPEYVVFTLRQPDRIVIDFKNTDIIPHFQKHLPKQVPIENMRLHLAKDYLRIVFQLKRPLQAQSFLLPPANAHAYRLVVDLTPGPVSVQTPAPQLPVPQRRPKMIPVTAVPVTTAPVVSAPATLPTAKGRPIIIVIDPGHGGKDPGTTGYTGTHEKDVVLAIARYLQQALNQEPGFRAVLTRTGDYYIPLRGRLDLARKYKADMFVSVHADAYPEPGALGASVFALSPRGATSEAARWLAEKENKSELLGGASLPDNDNVLRSVLIDLSQTNTISESLQIGSAILFQLGKITLLHHPRVEQAAFVVLKSPDIPSVLVETGFLSTPAQERQLRDPQYQRLLASAIMQGIKGYFMRNPPQGTWYSGGESS